MKKVAFLALPLLLSGCYVIPFIPIMSQSSDNNISIASDIPASTMPCIAVPASNQSEVSMREAVMTGAETALLSGNFRQLEDDYALHRQRTSRTPGGRWKLQFFYSGLSRRTPQTEQGWSTYEARLLQWMKEYPRSPAAHIAYSSFLIKRAWNIRGDGYAREVQPQSWRPFEQNIELARDSLQDSKEFASNDPQWYVEMLVVARAQAWRRTELKQLLQEAISKEAYYQETYQTAFEYLLPKWHGSFEEAETFANDAVAITRQCEGNGMYARIYWRVIDSTREFQHDPFGSAKVSWEKMKLGLEDIITRYPNAWNINNYAKFACLAGDKETAKRLVKQIGNNPTPEAWNNQISFPDCRKWALGDA